MAKKIVKVNQAKVKLEASRLLYYRCSNLEKQCDELLKYLKHDELKKKNKKADE